MSMIARFHFLPEFASDFIDSPDGDQQVIEMEMPDADSIIEYCREYEDYLEDVCVIIGAEMLSLLEISQVDSPTSEGQSS